MIVEPITGNSVVTGAIRQAARMTGADFRYLLATAQVESGLNPRAQAGSSSAKGLFQFIDQTWLATLKEQGPALGYAPYSAGIARTASGKYVVSNARMYHAIMNLRADPTANALMAGAFTKANTDKLTARLGRNPTEGELYIAHFLGAGGAGRLISLADSAPQTPAAAVFSGPAQANRSIFFDRRGNARSIGQVYRVLVGRYEVARGQPPSTPTMAATVADNKAAAFAPDAEFDGGAAAVPDLAAIAENSAAAATPSLPETAPTPSSSGREVHAVASVFNGLFRTAGAEEPVAPIVSALWTSPPSASSPPSALHAAVASSPAADSGGSPLDLFQEQPPDVAALFRSRA